MRHKLAFTLCLSAICGLMQPAVLAQQDAQNFYRPPSSFAGKTVVLPIGTTFEGRIQSTIGSSHSRSGETFSVEVSAPVLANGSDVLIPSGSEIVGEVAEAISSSAQPHDKNQYRPMGILRVQLTSIRFPDGQTYPMVASFAPDGSRNRGTGGLTARKSSVAYVGTQAGFDAVNPANQQRNNRAQQGKLQVMKQSEIMNDPILGDSGNRNGSNGTQIRSLIRKGRDLMILRGSSMTIRLDSPLKIAMGGSTAQNSMQTTSPDAAASMPTGKHFSKSRTAPAGNAQPQPGQDDQGMAQQQAPPQGGYPPQQGGNPPQQGGYPPQGGQQQGYNQQPTQPPVDQPGSSF